MVVIDIGGSGPQVCQLLEGCWSVNRWLMSDCLPACFTVFEGLSVSNSSALGVSNNKSEATSCSNITCFRHSVLPGRLAISTEQGTQATGSTARQLQVISCQAVVKYFYCLFFLVTIRKDNAYSF